MDINKLLMCRFMNPNIKNNKGFTANYLSVIYKSQQRTVVKTNEVSLILN